MMRLHDWWNDCMMTWFNRILLNFLCFWFVEKSWFSLIVIETKAKATEGLTDQRTDWRSYRDVRMHLVNLENLLWHLFAEKYRFPLLLTKVRRAEGRRDSYRYARTHLKRLWKQLRLIVSVASLLAKLPIVILSLKSLSNNDFQAWV